MSKMDGFSQTKTEMINGPYLRVHNRRIHFTSRNASFLWYLSNYPGGPHVV